MARAIRIEGDVAFIPLTRGYEAIIDATDAPLVQAFNWCAKLSRGTVYGARTVQIGPKRDGKQKHFLLHRVLLDAPAGMMGDHIDGDGLNNRRSNLRLATPAQNTRNTCVRRDSKSGLKGTAFDKRRGKWAAYIKECKRQKHLGYFGSPEAAHAAYVAAAKRIFGEYARVS